MSQCPFSSVSQSVSGRWPFSSDQFSVSFLAGGGIPLPRACAHHPCAVLRSRGAKYSDFPVLVLLLVLALALRILAPALALGILALALAGAGAGWRWRSDPGAGAEDPGAGAGWRWL